MTNDKHPPNSDSPEDQSNKHIALMVAVVVATLFIVVAWLIFLPYQLRQANLLGDDEAARWQEVREDVRTETTSFRESLHSLRGQYDELEERVILQEGSQTEGVGDSRVPPEVIERLRDKLSELQSPDSDESGDDITASETDSDIQEETHASQEIE